MVLFLSVLVSLRPCNPAEEGSAGTLEEMPDELPPPQNTQARLTLYSRNFCRASPYTRLAQGLMRVSSFDYEPPIPIPKTPSATHPHARRSGFRRRDAHRQSRSSPESTAERLTAVTVIRQTVHNPSELTYIAAPFGLRFRLNLRLRPKQPLANPRRRDHWPPS